jgi:hypothetical protein
MQGAGAKKRRTLLGEDFLDEAQMNAFIDTDDRAFSMGAAGPKKGKGGKRKVCTLKSHGHAVLKGGVLPHHAELGFV